MSTVEAIQEVQNKTQQRIASVVSLLRKNPTKAYGYPELVAKTGMAYDTLLYVLHTLECVDLVTKHETPDGPGRPKVTFQWAQTRDTGSRRSA